MSEYVMLPGAELEIGPHGEPMETLGQWGSSKFKTAMATLRQLPALKQAQAQTPAPFTPQMPGYGPGYAPSFYEKNKTIILIGGAAAAGLLIWKLKKRKR